MSMLRKTLFLSLSLPLAWLMGCESTSGSDTTTTTDAIESCFSTAQGSTRCEIQTAATSVDRGDRDVDGDGRGDRFVCAHIVHVKGGAGRPHDGAGGAGPAGGDHGGKPDGNGGRGAGDWANTGAGHGPDGAGGARPPAGAPGASGQHGPALDVPGDVDCGKLGCVDMRPAPDAGDAPAGAAGASGHHGDDMRCPGARPDGAGGAG